MKVTLPILGDVLVKTEYKFEEITVSQKMGGMVTQKVPHGTEISVDKAGLVVYGCSTCHPKDRFEKLKGRKFALTNLFQQHPNLFHKQDREVLFKTLCSKFFKTRTRKRKRREA